MTPKEIEIITEKICRARDFRNFEAAMAEVQQAITAAVEAEREACAKIVDEGRERITASNYQADVGRRFAAGIAAQIRARSKAEQMEGE